MKQDCFTLQKKDNTDIQCFLKNNKIERERVEIVLTISILPGLLDGPVCRLRDRHLKGGFKAHECIKGAHLARPSVLTLLYCLFPFNYRKRLMITRERKARGARASSTTFLNQNTYSQARHMLLTCLSATNFP